MSEPADKGRALYDRARHLIPGGTQLLSKRPEMFLPEQWPNYYAKAKGAEVWDLDGRRLRDFTHCAVGTCPLGFADPHVDAAAMEAIRRGSMSTLNSPDEVTLAELWIALHPWAEMARFVRAGAEAVAMAVRIARAATGRDQVAVCGYHGWFDWYLAANVGDTRNLDGHMLPGLDPKGVPRVMSGTALPFAYNDIAALDLILDGVDGGLAAIVMEPRRDMDPEPGFVQAVRERADRYGAVLIFDEVTSGFRMNTGGIHMTMGVEPDLAVFAKGMSNGYPMGAVIGRTAVMEAAQTSFISSTYWTEAIGPAAALAAIRKHRDLDVASHLIRIGTRIQAGWTEAARSAGLTIHVRGIPPLSGFAFDGPRENALATLFNQEMLDRGYLASTLVYIMLAHTDELVDGYLEAVATVFDDLAKVAAAGTIGDRLRGPERHTGFKRLN